MKQHNEDMEKRHDSSHNQSDDGGKVDKGFWSGEQRPMITSCSGLPGLTNSLGQGGADRDP